MAGLARQIDPAPLRRMPKVVADQGADQERALRARALKVLRKRADLTQEEAASRVNVQPGSWRRYEWGERELSLDKLGELAGALGYKLEDLLNIRDELASGQPHDVSKRAAAPVVPLFPNQGVLLPIRDRVQAGAWLVADDVGQVPKTYPAARDPRYPYAEQWLSEVVGDSVDLLGIREGDLVQLVSAIDINYQPKTGDVVEVERLRFGGHERELTLKELEVLPGGAMRLWPRSSNARYKEPLELRGGVGEDEEIEVIIRGLLVAAIRRF